MKIKKLLSLLAAATMALTALTGTMTVSASTVDTGTCGDLTWTLDSDGKLTISGKGEMGSPNVTHVTQANGFTNTMRDGLKEALETQLKDYSDIYTYKKYTEDIKEVVIEEGVTSIGFAAFYKMPNIEAVALPSTISEFKGIGYSCLLGGDSHGHGPIQAYASLAFAECTKLKNLTLTEGMTAIGSIAFYGCTALEGVRIPSTILDEAKGYYEDHWDDGGNLKANFGWGPFSFTGCTSLKNITLPEGLTIIGASAFEDAAVEGVVIPSTIEKWDNVNSYVYDGNKNLIEMCSSAFGNCEKLSSVTFTDGLKVIGEDAFWGCTSLKKVAIPASVTNMESAFAYCTGLEEAYIEEGAIMPASNYTDSGIDLAFNNCTNLKRLEIPAGVNVSYNNPRYITGCSSLTDIYLHGKDYKLYIAEGNAQSKFHCYSGTSTFDTLLNKNKIDGNRLIYLENDISATLKELNTVVSEAKAIDEEKYTPESYAATMQQLVPLFEKAETYGNDSNIMSMEDTIEAMKAAIKGLENKPVDQPSNPSNTSETQPTTNKTTTKTPTTAKAPATTNTPAKTTRSAAQVKKDKTAAQKAMKQAKLTKLTAKSKAKKITVTWKKVKKAKGYQVQVSAKKNFKKVIYNKLISKNKLIIKNSKIKSKKTYYIRVRAYSTYNDANGKAQKIYSKWNTKIRKIKVK